MLRNIKSALPLVALLFLVAAFILAMNCLALAETGKASWYSLTSRTASGERCDPSALTAAHKSLPFGTRVRVKNLDNGKSVVVRINDRGPFIRGRIIDLTKAAARQIGMVEAGTAQVRIDVVR